MAKYEDKRQSRSQKYQWLICEFTVSNEILSYIPNSRSIENHLNPFHYNERYYELEDLLKQKTWQIAKEVCTPKQFAVLNLVLDGYTQTEISNQSGTNQSGITKSLFGNYDYNNKKRYGGVIPKMKRYIKENKEIKEILEEMNNLLEEKF
jgi:hypothetical protein